MHKGKMFLLAVAVTFVALPLFLSLTPSDVAAQPRGLEVVTGYYKGNYVSDNTLLMADKDPNNWVLPGKSYKTDRWSTLSQINTGNISKLAPRYIVSFGVLDGQKSQAVAINGMLYVVSSYNRVFAVDAASGTVVWRYDHELPGDVYPKLCCDVVNSGVGLYKDKVYLATLDAHVVALNNATGEVVWDKKVGDYTVAESFTTAPLALNGKVMIGSAGAEYGTRLWIAALDAETGEEVWRTYTIPGPGEPGNETWAGDSWKYGGASAWSMASYDPELNLIYWPIGNPGPDFDRHVRAGDNLYTDSIIALNPDTGKIQFHFQHTQNDPYDYDSICEVILDDIDGQKVWLHADRNGYLYKNDRTNGKFIAGVPYVKVNWSKGLDKNGKPTFNYPEKDVVYDRVTNDIYPGLDGGKNEQPAAYNPNTKRMFIPVFEMPMSLQALKMDWISGEWYLGAKVITINPGHGEYQAWDMRTMKPVWKDYNETPPRSGTLATAGGLVFWGDPEGVFTAHDQESGARLWEFQTGTEVKGKPTTFTVNGEQLIAIPVGRGGGGLWPLTFGTGYGATHQKGGYMIVFGLVK